MRAALFSLDLSLRVEAALVGDELSSMLSAHDSMIALPGCQLTLHAGKPM